MFIGFGQPYPALLCRRCSPTSTSRVHLGPSSRGASADKHRLRCRHPWKIARRSSQLRQVIQQWPPVGLSCPFPARSNAPHHVNGPRSHSSANLSRARFATVAAVHCVPARFDHRRCRESRPGIATVVCPVSCSTNKRERASISALQPSNVPSVDSGEYMLFPDSG